MTIATLGLALGADRAVIARGSRVEVRSFDAALLAAGDASALATLLVLATRDLPARRSLHVALAAPFTAPRLLTLPPMREHEAARVLSRDASRWFPMRRRVPVVAVRRVDATRWLAADADGEVLDAIHRAAREAGFSAVHILPAVAALATSGALRDAHFVFGDETVILTATPTAITALQRRRTADLASSTSAPADGLARAAVGAMQAATMEFVAPAMAAERAFAANRMVRRLHAVALAFAVIAATLFASRAAHRVARLSERRAALRSSLAPLMAMHDSLVTLREAALVLGAPRGSRWSARLAAVGAALPRGAVLRGVMGDADSLRIEGTGARDLAVRLRSLAEVAEVKEQPTTADGAFAVVIVYRPERTR